MELLKELIGEGDKLSPLQMTVRTVIIFIVTLILIRLSGRRSFGMRMPLDNVITILLGGILSRAVVGASPFCSTLAAATTIAVMHRLFGWLGFYSKWFGKVVKGEEKIIYSGGKIHEENMKHCMLTEKDLLEGIRLGSNMNSVEEVDEVYMERDGQISVVKKE
jgi:uncharacterized membrane protein YcaP (DUF421 family)